MYASYTLQKNTLPLENGEDDEERKRLKKKK